jgi:hypothetical protein
MNDNDLDNFEFLMNVSPQVFEDWFNQTDSDDITYALELLARVNAQVDVIKLEANDEVKDFTEAQYLLAKFTK